MSFTGSEKSLDESPKVSWCLDNVCPTFSTQLIISTASIMNPTIPQCMTRKGDNFAAGNKVFGYISQAVFTRNDTKPP